MLFIGACVPVFAAGFDHEGAVKAAVREIVGQGFEFMDIEGPVRQLDPNRRSDFVDASLPEFKSQLPSQEAVIAGFDEGSVFFGPFVGYDKQGA